MSDITEWRLTRRGWIVAIVLSLLGVTAINYALRDTCWDGDLGKYGSCRVMQDRYSRAAPVPQVKEAVKATVKPTPVVKRASRSLRRSPTDLGRIMAAERGWRGSEWSCLRSLWAHESRWQPRAQSKHTVQGLRAGGIPQILGMDPDTPVSDQIQQGLDYIGSRYGSPCAAWTYWKGKGYQDDRGWHGGWY